MKTHLHLKNLLKNQEVLESGKCLNFCGIPCLNNIIICTKKNTISNEKFIYLKSILFQLFFGLKPFILVSFNNFILKKFPIAVFITIRKTLNYFLDYFFHMVLSHTNKMLLLKSKSSFFKLIFKKNNNLISHFLRYSLYLSI